MTSRVGKHEISYSERSTWERKGPGRNQTHNRHARNDGRVQTNAADDTTRQIKWSNKKSTHKDWMRMHGPEIYDAKAEQSISTARKHTRCIYIGPDLTRKERLANKDLREELKARRARGEENIAIRRNEIVTTTLPLVAPPLVAAPHAATPMPQAAAPVAQAAAPAPKY